MNGFVGALHVTRIDGTRWLVTEAVVYRDASGSMWSVPAGFVTDFASAWIGRWSLLPRKALYCASAVLHDYLYHLGVTTRAHADRLYREAMLSEGISTFHAWKAYLGVRAFGWAPWNTHRKAKR